MIKSNEMASIVGHCENCLYDIKVKIEKNGSADQKEALEMIATKMGRIVNGDPDYLDSWLDIQGYCQLIIDRVRKDKIALDNAVDMYVVEGVPKETAIQLQRSDDE